MWSTRVTFVALVTGPGLWAGCAQSSSGTAGPAGPGGAPPPPVSGTADVQFTVSGAGGHAISPYVYGMNLNFVNLDMFPPNPYYPPPKNLGCFRIGGSDWSEYNWVINANNVGPQFNNGNAGYFLLPGDPAIPGGAVKARIADSFARGASIVVTVPMLGYVSADTTQTPVTQTTDYLHVRFKPTVARKGTAFGPGDPAAPVVYGDELVNSLETRYPGAHDPAKPNIFYSLDNEPDFWQVDHPATHPGAVTYAEVLSKTADYAGAIKAVAPAALVFGPGTGNWYGNVNLNGAPDAASYAGDFLDAYLGATKGLVDVLDVHWYPVIDLGSRVMNMADASMSELVDADAQAVRVQLPRSLWDPTYVENSAITRDNVLGTAGTAIRLIPRLKDKINAQNPGMKGAFTEYYFGGNDDISGAIAQADAFGIFGAQGLFAATVFPLGANNTTDRYLYAACNMFRNYDGANAAFGDTSLPSTTSSVEQTSIYASTDAASRSRIVLVALNKTTAPHTASIDVAFDPGVTFTSVEVYQLTAASSSPGRLADIKVATASGTTSFPCTMPAMSVTTLVLRR